MRLTLTLALLLGGLALPVSPAQADEQSDVTVDIDEVSPAIIDTDAPDDVITVSGTVTNNTDQELRYLVVQIWSSADPITEESDLNAVLASDPMNPIGQRLQQEHLGHVEVISRDEPFEPGATQSFKVQGTVAELGFTRNDAAYLIGAHARVVQQETVGRGRALVVATKNPLQRSTVVPLTYHPTRDDRGRFTSEDTRQALINELSTRLLRLTRGAEQYNSTVLLDPMLLSDIQALAVTHATADGTEHPGIPLADQWLSTIDDMAVENRVFRLPYAGMNVTRLHNQGLIDPYLGWGRDQVDAWVRRLPEAALIDNTASPELLQALADANLDTVFTSNMTSGLIGEMAVHATTSLELPGVPPGDVQSPAQILGRRLATELLAPTPPLFVIRNLADLHKLELLTDAHEDTALAQPSGEPQTTGDPAEVESWTTVESRVKDYIDRADFITDLTGVDESGVLHYSAVTSMSQAWEEESTALAWLNTSPVAQADPSQITINAAQQFVMGARTNEFPVTVTNNMAYDVTVRLTFSSDMPQRISVPPTEFVTVPAGESATINVAPNAAANGVVLVDANLQTRGGTTFGPTTELEITATDFGRVGWIIIIVSGAVVLGGTAWRIRAVRAEQAKESSE